MKMTFSPSTPEQVGRLEDTPFSCFTAAAENVNTLPWGLQFRVQYNPVRVEGRKLSAYAIQNATLSTQHLMTLLIGDTVFHGA